MDRKLRHVLIFLLIILKEPNMPEAGCSCTSSSICNCNNLDLTNIPQNLPLQKLYLNNNEITTIPSGTFANLPELKRLSLSFNQIAIFPFGTFANLPKLQALFLNNNQITTIDTGSFSNLPQLHDLALDKNQITTIASGAFANLPQLQRLYLHSNQIATFPSEMPESAPSSLQATTSTRIADIQLISYNYHYHWYFKFNASPMSDPAGKTRATLASHLAITSSKPESARSSPLPVLNGSVCGSVAGIVLIGTFLAVIWYKKRTRSPPFGLNPGVVGSNTNTAVSVMVSGHNQRGQGESQANTESNITPKATVMTNDNDHQYEDIDKLHVKTEQGQSQANTESNTNTTDTKMTSGHDQTGQGQSQAVTESLDVRNLSYGTGRTASQQNSVYKVVTQYQTITALPPVGRQVTGTQDIVTI
ncbi:corticospinal neuron axon guidance through spinal cord [Branchiostoma belcheri]|nr:corticospinal neuron axon guidance through spinal cord [Branchiostoma belcheri]